jgi:hypothetical protein
MRVGRGREEWGREREREGESAFPYEARANSLRGVSDRSLTRNGKLRVYVSQDVDVHYYSFPLPLPTPPSTLPAC